MGEWRYSSTILALGSKWRWVVSFTSLPLYPQENSLRYLLDTRLGGPQSRSGRYGEEKNFPPVGIRTSVVQTVTIPTELFRLYNSFCFWYTHSDFTKSNFIVRSLSGTCSACCLLHSGFSLDLLFNPTDRSDTFLRNVGWLSVDYTTLYPRTQKSYNQRCVNLKSYMFWACV
jgi:hypothetical protein